MTQINEKKRYTGTIIHIDKDKGFFFIVSKQLPFTRIFAHWSGLVPTTLHFSKLEKGMPVWFHVINYMDKQTGVDKGLRAIKITVDVDNETPLSNENTVEQILDK